jgi:regulatory protein
MNIKPSNQSASNKSPHKRAGQRKEKRPPKKITASYLHNSGLYYLQRFSSSSENFRQVMIRKARKSCMHHTDQSMEDCLELINALVEKFISAGLLDDESYTRGVVSSLRRQGKSRRAILAKLRSKGLSADLVSLKLEEHDEEKSDIDAELRAALVFSRKKKIGPYKNDRKTEHEKMLASMARAGFSYETSRSVLEMGLDEAEKLIRL